MKSDTKNIGHKRKLIFNKIKTYWKIAPAGRYLSLKEILRFGGSAIGISLILSMLSAVVTASQISEVYQISVIHGPVIVFCGSIIGLLFQPFYSKILQNTNSRMGRYKPYIIILAPVVSLLAVAVTWVPQNFSGQGRTLYAYLTCIPAYILWQILINTFHMMPAVITPNRQERADIWSPISMLMGLAPSLVSLFKGFVRGYFLRRGTEYLAYRYMGLISVILGIALVFLILKVKERIISTAENSEKVKIFYGLRMVMKNKPLMILTAALTLGCMRDIVGMDMEILGRLRYAGTLDRGGEIYSSLTLIAGFASTPNMILLPFMTRKMASKTIVMIWGSFNLIGYTVLAIIGIQNIPVGATSAAVITVFRFVALFQAMGSLLPLMLSEIYDYQQYISGKRLEGFIQTFAYSLVTVLANVFILAIGFIKQNMGFEPKNYFNVLTVSDAHMNIATTYFNVALWISAASAALMIIMISFYNLTRKRNNQIVEELMRRSSEEKLLLDAITKQKEETLS